MPCRAGHTIDIDVNAGMPMCQKCSLYLASNHSDNRCSNYSSVHSEICKQSRGRALLQSDILTFFFGVLRFYEIKFQMSDTLQKIHALVDLHHRLLRVRPDWRLQMHQALLLDASVVAVEAREDREDRRSVERLAIGRVAIREGGASDRAQEIVCLRGQRAHGGKNKRKETPILLGAHVFFRTESVYRLQY